MVFYLFLLFTVLPIVELAILIRIGEATEWWMPVTLVIFTGIAGAALARWQGLRVFQRVRDDTRAGRMPGDSLVDAFLVLLAGLLLIFPGVLTDFIGIALLIPPIRALVKRGVKAWMKRHIEVRVGSNAAAFWTSAGSPPRVANDEIIDARVIGTRVEDVNPSSLK